MATHSQYFLNRFTSLAALLSLSSAATLLAVPVQAQTQVIFGQSGQIVQLPSSFNQQTIVYPPSFAYPPLLPFPVQNNHPTIYRTQPYNQPNVSYPYHQTRYRNYGNNQPIIYQPNSYNQPTLIYPQNQNQNRYRNYGNNQPIIYQASPHNQPVLIYPPHQNRYRNYGNNQPMIYQASPHNQPVLIYGR